MLPLLSVLGRVGLGCSLWARKSSWRHTVLSSSAKFARDLCNESCCQCSRFLTPGDNCGFVSTGKSHTGFYAFPSFYWLKGRFWWNAFCFTLVKGIQAHSCVINTNRCLQRLIPDQHRVQSQKITFTVCNRESLLVSSMLYKLVGFICCCQDSSNHTPKVSDTSAPHAVVLHDFPAGK